MLLSPPTTSTVAMDDPAIQRCVAADDERAEDTLVFYRILGNDLVSLLGREFKRTLHLIQSISLLELFYALLVLNVLSHVYLAYVSQTISRHGTLRTKHGDQCNSS